MINIKKFINNAIKKAKELKKQFIIMIRNN